MLSLRTGLACVLAVLGAPATSAADGSSFWSRCELQTGFGATYHYWGWTHSPVVPIIVTLDDDRWELGAFRIPRNQTFYDETFVYQVHFANPYWGFSASRRFELFKHRHWRLLAGIGASYKTEEDTLSSSLWNISEQLGVRITPIPGLHFDLVGRHWSNGGLKLPNHGQDFATLTVSIIPGLLGHRPRSF